VGTRGQERLPTLCVRATPKGNCKTLLREREIALFGKRQKRLRGHEKDESGVRVHKKLTTCVCSGRAQRIRTQNGGAAVERGADSQLGYRKEKKKLKRRGGPIQKKRVQIAVKKSLYDTVGGPSNGDGLPAVCRRGPFLLGISLLHKLAEQDFWKAISDVENVSLTRGAEGPKLGRLL